MPEDYYPIPPSFGALMKRQPLADKISVEESIAQNISLYLASKPKEYHFDHNYGCIIHGYDFRQLKDTPSKDQIKRTVEEYLRKFEKRIVVNRIDIEINDVEERVEGGNPRICRYIQIVIASTLVQTQEKLKEMKFRLIRYS